MLRPKNELPTMVVSGFRCESLDFVDTPSLVHSEGPLIKEKMEVCPDVPSIRNVVHRTWWTFSSIDEFVEFGPWLEKIAKDTWDDMRGISRELQVCARDPTSASVPHCDGFGKTRISVRRGASGRVWS